MLLRLDKILSSQNICTRSEAKILVKNGSVLINGNPAKRPDIKVDTDTDEITVLGEKIRYREHIYIMMNKPLGVISAIGDKMHKTVLDLVPESLFRPGLFPAGRLDRDTEGFVLLTDDGDFAHNILSPSRHVQKTYHAVLDAPVQEEDVRRFSSGMTLASGEVCKPAKLTPLSKTEPHYEVVLTEGKYHQIKRMFGALGRLVVSLKRTKIGSLMLDPGLLPGECRELTEEELAELLG